MNPSKVELDLLDVALVRKLYERVQALLQSRVRGPQLEWGSDFRGEF